MGDKIEIMDLLDPVLTPDQEAAIAAAEAQPPVSLTADEVLAAASEESGLSDFGSDDFRPRLQLWLSEGEADKNLNALGRASIFNKTKNYALNRLRVEDMVKRHPEILEIEIDRPIIVAGLPRGGTTHLQSVLSADPRLRKLPMWEAVAPAPGPDDAPTSSDPNPRRTRYAAENARSAKLLPYKKSMHDLSEDSVSEDIELQCLAFGSYYLEWHTLAANWRDSYLSSDNTSVYEYVKKALQIMTFQNGPNRWVLKCPQHMEQLIPLFKVFPDATVAVAHRDPVASVQSACVMILYGSRMSRRRIDGDAVVSYWIDRYRRMLEAYIRDRDAVPNQQIIDVYFHELMLDPMKIVADVYRKAALPFTQTARDITMQYLEDNQRGKHGSVAYDLRRDFGLSGADIRKHYDFYCDRFPIETEVR
jgi:hypothetical protein